MKANTNLEVEVGSLFAEVGLTLALAESCTGGLIANRLTDVPGSSLFLLGGVVAYANEVKEQMVGVRRATLVEHGAVSEAVAREMAQGIRERLGADVGLSVTGIAGPGGGTDDKPVGLAWVGLSTSDSERAERFVWPFDRVGNKVASAEAALKMLIEYAQVKG